MKIKEIKIAFRESYAKLFVNIIVKIDLIRRDIEEFKQFGITATDIDKFEASANKLHHMKSDIAYRVEQVEKTSQKNAKAEELRIQLKKMFNQIGLSEAGWLLKGLHSLSVVNISDDKLIRKANLLIKIKSVYSEELTTNIIPNTYFIALKKLIKQLISLIEIQDLYTATREIETQRRRKFANHVYKQYSNYCKTGQIIWFDRNNVFYKNYLMNE